MGKSLKNQSKIIETHRKTKENQGSSGPQTDGTERGGGQILFAGLPKKHLLLALTQLRIARTKRKRKSFPVRGRLTTATPPNLRYIYIYICYIYLCICIYIYIYMFILVVQHQPTFELMWHPMLVA